MMCCLDAKLLSGGVLYRKARNPANTGFSGKKSRLIQGKIQAVNGGWLAMYRLACRAYGRWRGLLWVGASSPELPGS
ncbi:hypothetical protein [Candidatus Nitrotoga fabula]|uniref:hypothetical protein n=1 Tax=Candidatus Nitrotoga fabula TaxID=2182327 RepID=UPI001BB479BE|nr:hypothetical protein [Candidatus Nitrotoga fabula]